MITCPNCGHENADDEKICVRCGTLLGQYASTRALPDADYEEGTAKWGSARFSERMLLILSIEQNPRALIFNANEVEQLLIGRRNPDTGEAPDVDLSDYEAHNKGVSREHAAIVRKDGSLHIVDRGSANGTYLNGQRLVANQPRVLRDGDDVRLGHLVMRVSFERASSTHNA